MLPTDVESLASCRDERLRLQVKQAWTATKAVWVYVAVTSLLFVPNIGSAPYLGWAALVLASLALRDFYLKRKLKVKLLSAEDERHLGWAFIVGDCPIYLAAPLFLTQLDFQSRLYYTILHFGCLIAAMFVVGLNPKAFRVYVAMGLSILATGGWLFPSTPMFLITVILHTTIAIFIILFSQRLTSMVEESIAIKQTHAKVVGQLTIALEQAASAQHARSRFLAAASHDLLQPVHALSLLVDVLNDAKNPEVQTQATRRIVQTTSVIEGMFRSLLDLARLDAGAVQTHINSLRLRVVLDSIVAAYELQCKALGLALAVDCPTGLTVQADTTLLDRALRNVVDNAVKYTRQGGISIRARAESGKSKEDRVEIVVSDSGEGISLQEHGRLFDDFFRGEKAQQSRTPGIGLGLSVTRQLLELMDGAVKIQSTPGNGTSVTITVPAAAVIIHGEPVPENPLPPPRPLAFKRLLLVEDDRQAGEALRFWLSKLGGEVIAASSLTDALGKCHRHSFTPDCILSDLRLQPGPGGLHTIASLRERFGRMPAILITGEAIGANEVPKDIKLMRKPVDTDALRKTLADTSWVP